MTAAAALRMQIRPPRLALLPVATPPRGGLLLSALIHAAAVFAVLTWLPLLFPGRSIIVTHTTADILRDPDQEVLMLPVLPQLRPADSRTHLEKRSGKTDHAVTKVGPGTIPTPSSRPKLNYASPQEIVSSFPDSTSDVQTIIRPDLPAPPKLKYPVRLPSMVMLPPPTAPTRVVPQLEQPSVPNPVQPVPFQVSEPRVQAPVLPMGAPIQSSAIPAEQAVPKITDTLDRNLPVFPTPAAPEPTVPKAVVVLNAVSISSESAAAIPDAELSGSFVAGPSRDESTVKTESARANGNMAAAGPSNARGDSLNTGGENGIVAGVHAVGGDAPGEDAGVGNAAAVRTESLPGVGARVASSSNTSVGAQSGGLPGISISGGISGRSGRAVGTSSISRGSYGITIISGGSSGGASRDLGVFSRGDTVYTVYIPMSDAGGGPDWPIEYAPMRSAPTGNVLLTPPVVLKKIQATEPKADASANSGPVFVAGIIDENGRLKALHAIHAPDVRGQSAVNALSQWEFLPAQLEGKPVATRVLIGVSVMPTQEVRRQN